MSKTKNDFEIIFKKLEEAKNDQNEINVSQFKIIQEVNDEIEIMKEYLESLNSPEITTFTRA